ncbi:Protein of unknown function [Gryllus bimaculatus]|nr:Protein of unknown function [Gryllus bimaculatus]
MTFAQWRTKIEGTALRQPFVVQVGNRLQTRNLHVSGRTPGLAAALQPSSSVDAYNMCPFAIRRLLVSAVLLTYLSVTGCYAKPQNSPESPYQVSITQDHHETSKTVWWALGNASPSGAGEAPPERWGPEAYFAWVWSPLHTVLEAARQLPTLPAGDDAPRLVAASARGRGAPAPSSRERLARVWWLRTRRGLRWRRVRCCTTWRGGTARAARGGDAGRWGTRPRRRATGDTALSWAAGRGQHAVPGLLAPAPPRRGAPCAARRCTPPRGGPGGGGARVACAPARS